MAAMVCGLIASVLEGKKKKQNFHGAVFNFYIANQTKIYLIYLLAVTSSQSLSWAMLGVSIRHIFN